MIIPIFGKRALGKSTLALYIAERVADRLVVFDPRNSFSTTGSVTLDFVADDYDLAEHLEELERGRIVVRPGGDLVDASVRLATEIEWYLADHPRASLAVIIDDAGVLSKNLDAWNRLFRTADRARVWFVITVHRPMDLAPIVRGLADWWIVFRTTEASDLDVIAGRCGREFADRCATLRPREFWLWNDTTVDDDRKMVFYGDPDVWRRDLAAPGVAVTRRPA